MSPSQGTQRAILRGLIEAADVAGALRTCRRARDVLAEAGMEESAEELRDKASFFHARIVSAAMKAGKAPDYIAGLLGMADSSGLEISLRDYDRILSDCCGSPRKTDAAMVAKHVLSRRRSQASGARFPRPPDAALLNRVMKLMGSAKKWWAALEVFETMKREGPEPDAESAAIIRSHFNSLLAASRSRGTSGWSVQLLQKMEEHGFTPDRFAWDTSLVACARRVDPKSAVAILQKMVEKGHQPNVLSYGALLSTLEKARLTEKAELVWEHMRASKVEPNIVAYTVMISVFGGARKMPELDRLLLEMRESGATFTLVTYNTLITVYAQAGDARRAHRWMLELIAAGFTPDSVSYGQLIKGLRRWGSEALAEEMY
jgi:pentatricopeptide repeat protein